MTINPSSWQALLLWSLIAEGGWGLQKDRAFQVTKAIREGLIKAGLLEMSLQGRTILLEVTDKGWAWAARHPDVELPKTQSAAPIFRSFLMRLMPFLQERGIALAELFPIEGGMAPPARGETEQHIHQAYLQLTHGNTKQRVRLHQLRAALPDLDRATLDLTLLEMQRQGLLVLMTLDNSREITAADREAALDIGGNPRHILYFGA